MAQNPNNQEVNTPPVKAGGHWVTAKAEGFHPPKLRQ